VIIKCISRKSNVGQLIKYVLADCKMEPPVKQQKERPLYVKGVPLTDRDRKHLGSERSDSELTQLFKQYAKDGDIQKFIENHILKQQREDLEKRIPAVLIKQNIRARSIPGYIKAFEENEKMRMHVRSNNVKAYHHVISFSDLDKGQINENMLKDIAQKYIELRGGNSLFLGAVHHKENMHIHLIQSATQYCTGLANRVSQQQFQELKVAMQEYQMEKYPQLVNSVVDHKSQNRKTKSGELEKNKRDERTGKASLLGLLETTLTKSTSTEHFLNQLQALGHEPYYRAGRLQGIKYEGTTKFRLGRLGFDTKLKSLDMKKEKEDKELKELQQLRGGRTSRTVARKEEQRADKVVSLNAKELDNVTGIPAYDRLCDDCKKEHDDPTYRSPKYYDRDTFDANKYSDHKREEMMKIIDDGHASIDEVPEHPDSSDSENTTNETDEREQDWDELAAIREEQAKEIDDDLDRDDAYDMDR
jgi:hypothetical protein